MQPQADLFEIVDALDAPRRFAGTLDRGQEQGDQDRDDRDHDKEFDQREPEPRVSRSGPAGPPAAAERGAGEHGPTDPKTQNPNDETLTCETSSVCACLWYVQSAFRGDW